MGGFKSNGFCLTNRREKIQMKRENHPAAKNKQACLLRDGGDNWRPVAVAEGCGCDFVEADAEVFECGGFAAVLAFCGEDEAVDVATEVAPHVVHEDFRQAV